MQTAILADLTPFNAVMQVCSDKQKNWKTETKILLEDRLIVIQIDDFYHLGTLRLVCC
jgi:hypothetical protein